jgi:hypothetical protein
MDGLGEVRSLGPGIRRWVVDEHVGRTRSTGREAARYPDPAVVLGHGHLGQGDRRVGPSLPGPVEHGRRRTRGSCRHARHRDGRDQEQAQRGP